MRRQSRWDQKLPTPPGERSVPDWVNWRDNDGAFPSAGHDNRSPSTPAPLDYSTDNRWRAQEAAKNQPKNDGAKHSNLILPNTANLVQPEPWPVIPSYGAFPGSSRDEPVDYASHSAWNQPSSGFFIGSHSSTSQIDASYQSKWWLPVRDDSTDTYRGNGFRSKRDRRGSMSYHPNLTLDNRRNGKTPMERQNRNCRDPYANSYSSCNRRNVKFDRRESTSSSGKYMGNFPKESKKHISENNNDLDDGKYKKKKSKRSKSPDQDLLNLDPQLGFKEPSKQTPAEEAAMKAIELAAAKLKTKFLLSKGYITDGKLCESSVEDLSLPSSSSKHSRLPASKAPAISKNTSLKSVTIVLSDFESSSSTEAENVSQRQSRVKRKRHLSETLVRRKDTAASFELRRSCSENSFQVTPEQKIEVAAGFKRKDLKMADKIRSMDRKSLQQLIHDPTSAQAKEIAAQLMSLQKENESNRLLRLRFKTAPTTTIGRNSEDISEELPNHILEQVRQILSAEQNEDRKMIWEEINFPLSRTMNFKSPNKSSANISKEESMDLEIVTPPPKKPADMITIADSDQETVPRDMKEFRSRIMAKPLSDLVNKSSFDQEPLYDLPNSAIKKGSPIPPLLSPLSPIRSVSEPSDLTSRMTPNSKDTSIERPPTPMEKDVVNPPMASSPISNLNHSEQSFQVKLERSSPVSECGLCMHSPRSPHTPRCGFMFEMPHSPVPLIPGPPTRLPATAQRPVARIPPDLPRLFKHESYISRQSLFVNLENVDRPSSEERPKNPAPPDSASNEPPSPLPIPPPQQTIHNRPRALIFPPDNDFHAPPRPIPPQPPLHHSPRIKMERHTPQYSCCCLKSECERASNGRQSTDFLRPERRSVTPQLCDSRSANLFKLEHPPFYSSRTRTPQQLSAFSMPHSSRTLISHSPIRLPVCEPLHNEPSSASIAVQTEASERTGLGQDKSTNTQNLHVKENSAIHPLRVPEYAIASEYYKVMNQYDQISQSDNTFNNFGCEKDILECLQRIDDQTSRLHEYRSNLTEALKCLHHKRIQQYKFATSDTVDKASNTERASTPILAAFTVPRVLARESQSPENMSVVSSSQEVDSAKLTREHNASSPDRERCTSTSHADDIDIMACNDPQNQDPGFPHDQSHNNIICNMKFYHSPPQEIDLNSSNDDACANDEVMVMGEHRKICGLQSPSSPKCRNFSGSEHGYSLRSRGPPSESNECNSDSNQQSREPNDTSIEICEEPLSTDEKPDIDSPKRKRPRKTKYSPARKKRRSAPHLPTAVQPFVSVPKHKSSVLCLETVEKYILTASSDGTARLYDPVNGQIVATYKDQTQSVLAVHAIGKPSLGDFEVVTACEDKLLRFYDGISGRLVSRRETGDSIHCFASRWDLLFIGSLSGNCIKCHLKQEKKLSEKVQYSNRRITFLLPHTEGGRKVLVVGAKGSPVMVRDAISGLYLRALDGDSMTLFTGVFEGNVLYTAGTDRGISVYDFCSGHRKKTLFCPSAISQLLRVGALLIAVCYDGKLRLYNTIKGELVECLATESTKMIVSSALYDRKVLVGNKLGEVLSVNVCF